MRFRIFYIVSLAILGVLIGFALIRPATAGGEFSEVARERLIEAENKYIVEFAIINHEGTDTLYTINVSFDSYKFSQDVLIPNDRMFTYTHDIYTERLISGDISFAVYKAGEALPFEQVIYHLK